MKQKLMLLFTVALLSMSNTCFAISDIELHDEARFIADKIAYQFGFNRDELTDAYEINYDFLKGVYAIQDGLIAGDDKAIAKYYSLLDLRNSDMLWLMDHKRYASYVRNEALFRPVYVKNGQMRLRVYDVYDTGKLIGKKPIKFGKYNGEHSREKNDNESYYQGRHRYVFYGEQPRLLDLRNRGRLEAARKVDFGK